jgi:hypothetical protein
MFPLSLVQYGKLFAGALLLLGSFYFGWHLRDVDFQSYKAKQAIETQKIQAEHQKAADQIRKEKDAQIASINNSLADALSQLRGRPSRAQGAANGQAGTGLSLSAEDAGFLEREAARADILRAGLAACYDQYDSLNK